MGLDRLEARTIEHALRLVATACLLAFVLATPAAPASSGRRRTIAAWGWQVGALLLAVLALTLNTATTPVDLRDRLAGMANGDAVDGGGPVGSTSVALFFLIENIYYLVAFTITAVWVVGHLRREPLPTALGRGLRLLGVGSAVLVVATAALTVSVLVRWSGAAPPPAVNGVGLTLLALGLLVVVLGLAAPMVSGVISTLRIVRENRATARELEPLWDQLREAFPGKGPPPSSGSSALSYSASSEHASAPRLAAWLSRGYYRKLIGCRDGLHQLSPYLQEAGHTARSVSDIPTGPQLLAALNLRRESTLNHTGAPVIERAGDAIGFDDDVQVLVLLSQRLVETQRAQDGRCSPRHASSDLPG